MNISIPYIYPFDYVERSKRYRQRAWVKTHVDVSIEDVQDNKADIVFECGNIPIVGALHSELAKFKTFNGRPARVWNIKGDYFAEFVEVDDFTKLKFSEPFSNGNPYAVYAVDTDDTKVFCDLGLYTVAPEEEYLAKIGGYKEYDVSAKDMFATLVRRRTSDLKLIDGIICLRVGEPCLSIVVVPHDKDMDNRGVAPGVYLVVGESRPASKFILGTELTRKEKFLVGHRWRLDRKSEALSWAQEYAAEAGLPFFDKTVIAHFDKTHLVFNDDAEALGSSIKQVAKSLTGRLGILPSEVGVACYALLDALDENGERLTSAVIDAFRELSIAFELHGTKPHLTLPAGSRIKFMHGCVGLPADAYPDLERQIDALAVQVKRSLDRWDSRPRDGREWVESGLRVPSHVAPTSHVHEILSLDEAHRIGEVIRVDISDMAVQARDFGGHLVVSMSGTVPEAVALCFHQNDGLKIFESVGALGRPISAEAALKIKSYLDQERTRMDDDMALSSLSLIPE